MPDTSYQEMINVKKQFFKTDGIYNAFMQYNLL